jgi:hypothetical protein
LVAAIGICSLAETTLSASLDAPLKVFDEVLLLAADFGRGNARESKYSASKSAVLFPARTERYVRGALFLFGACPDVNREASKRKEGSRK